MESDDIKTLNVFLSITVGKSIK